MQSLLLVIASSRLDTKSSFLAKRSSFRQNLKVVSASNLKPSLQMLCLVHSLLNILETPHQCILLHEVRVVRVMTKSDFAKENCFQGNIDKVTSLGVFQRHFVFFTETVHEIYSIFLFEQEFTYQLTQKIERKMILAVY